MSVVLSFSNTVFSHFAFHAGVVIFKTMLMSIITSVKRLPFYVVGIAVETFFGNMLPAIYIIIRKAITPDPRKTIKGIQLKTKTFNMPSVEEAVESIRRCHLNDLENVVPFVLLGFLYVLTEPEVDSAILYFRLFTGFRFAHTVAYLLPLPQPSHCACFLGNFIINILMAYSVLIKGVNYIRGDALQFKNV